jgi:hypothetical protein
VDFVQKNERRSKTNSRGPRRRAGALADRSGGSHVDDARELELPAPGRCQGRVDEGGEANPRFVVTSLRRDECKAKHLYEKVYCARGEMENRIKECQLDLYADRTSAATMRANQLRLWFHSMAYVLQCALRRIGLHDAEFAQASCGTIRLKLTAQDRGARSYQRPRHGVGLPGGPRLGPRRIRLALATLARASRGDHRAARNPLAQRSRKKRDHSPRQSAPRTGVLPAQHASQAACTCAVHQ